MRSLNLFRPRVVFCDFDGTITATETFVAVLRRFAPDLSAQLIPQMYNRTLTLREGVRRLLESIPSAAYADIVAFVEEQPLRAGFPEFLNFLADQAVPCVVISGGIQGMVAAALAPYAGQIQALYGVDINTQSEYFQVHSPAESDTELVSKVALMARHPAQVRIAIGDSVTDLNMAIAADVVFARDRLATYLDERQISYYPWLDFHDIRSILTQQWQAE